MDVENLSEQLVELLLQINSRTFSLTNEMLEEIEDPVQQQIYAGLIYLHEDLRFNEEERNRVEEQRTKLYQQLLEMSREVGRSEVAANVLHNVGNVLNSVSVSTSTISRCANSPVVSRIGKVASILENAEDIGHLLTEDEHGKDLPVLLTLLAKDLHDDMALVRQECAALAQKVNHIKHVISMNESMASTGGLYEPSDLTEVVGEALAILNPAFEKHHVAVTQEFAPIPAVLLDRHRILQIVVNLLTNARDAVLDRGDGTKAVAIRTAQVDEELEITVSDTGEGIAEDALGRIFEHGFTTKPTGHGFGLHASALAADEMGGSLRCTHPNTNGDQQTVFVLRIPFKPWVAATGQP